MLLQNIPDIFLMKNKKITRKSCIQVKKVDKKLDEPNHRELADSEVKYVRITYI